MRKTDIAYYRQLARDQYERDQLTAEEIYQGRLRAEDEAWDRDQGK